MIIIKTLHFEDYEDFACAVADTYDRVKSDDKYNSVDVVAKYEDTKEIIRELVGMGYGIAFINKLSSFNVNFKCFPSESALIESIFKFLYTNIGFLFFSPNGSQVVYKLVESLNEASFNQHGNIFFKPVIWHIFIVICCSVQ